MVGIIRHLFHADMMDKLTFRGTAQVKVNMSSLGLMVSMVKVMMAPIVVASDSDWDYADTDY